MAILSRCIHAPRHVEGEIDRRVIAFCEGLAARVPLGDWPWMGPLGLGIDHVVTHLSWTTGDSVVEVIQELASRHDLVLFDLQSDDVYFPRREGQTTG